MRNNVNIMWKLGAVLAAPVLLLLVFAYVGVRDKQTEARKAQRVVELTTFVDAATNLLAEVEKEALLAARFSGSQGDDEQINAAYPVQQRNTQIAADELERRIDEVDPAVEDPLVKGSVTNLSSRLAGLSDHRATVTQRSTDGAAANAPYEHVTGALVDSIHQIANSLDDPVLFQRMSSVATIATLGAARAQVADTLAVAVEVGYFPAQLPKSGTAPSKSLGTLSAGCDENPAQARDSSCVIYEDLVAAAAAAGRATEDFMRIASPSDVPIQRSQSDESPLNDLVGAAIESGRSRNDLSTGTLGATPVEFADAATRMIDGYHTATREILLAETNPDAVATIARARADQARQDANRYTLVTAVALVVAGAVTVVVGWSIARSLRRSASTPPTEPVASSAAGG
jgi:hypothetical protein